MARKYTSEDVLRIVLRRRWLVVVPLALGIAAVGPIAGLVPKKYRSEALVMVVPQRVPDEYVKATVSQDIKERLPTITEENMSRARLENIIHELNLYQRARETQVMEDVVAAMRRDIGITFLGKNQDADSFRVSYENEDPRLAQQVTQRLASLYVEQNSLDRANQAKSTSEFLEAQLVEAKRRLVEHEQKLEAYRKRHAGQLPTQLASNLQALQGAQLQLQTVGEAMNRARERRLLVERQLADAHALPVLVPAGAAPVPAQPSPRQRLAAARKELQLLMTLRTREHPDVMRLERIIAELEPQAAEEPEDASGENELSPEQVIQRRRINELQADLEIIDHQLTTAAAEEARLKRLIADYQAKIDVVPTRESELVDLTRDYDTLQAAYSSLLLRRENSQVAADLERRRIGEQFKILDQASLPERPVNDPQRRKAMLGTVAAGLALGLLLVVLLEVRDTSFHREEDVMKALALPVLALVPRMASDVERATHRRRTMAMDLAGLVLMLGSLGMLAWWRTQL